MTAFLKLDELAKRLGTFVTDSALRRSIRHVVAAHPRLYRASASFRPRQKRLFPGPQTEVVIEGFPRTANTFAVLAFGRPQSGHVHISHHTHVPAAVIEGCRRRLPVLLLVRNPEDAAASFMIRHGRSARGALQDWLWFYRRCWPYRDRFLVATFEEVTTEYGRVIDRLNERYHTDFPRFSGEQVHVDSIIKEIDDIAVRFDQPGEHQVARPSDLRAGMKPSVLREIYEETRLLGECRALYQKYAELAS